MGEADQPPVRLATGSVELEKTFAIWVKPSPTVYTPKSVDIQCIHGSWRGLVLYRWQRRRLPKDSNPIASALVGSGTEIGVGPKAATVDTAIEDIDISSGISGRVSLDYQDRRDTVWSRSRAAT